MKTATSIEIAHHFQDYLAISREEPVVITKNRKPVAILMNVHEDADELERLILAHTPRFRAITEDAENRIQSSGGMVHDEFWNAVSKSNVNVCAETTSKYGAKKTRTR